MWADWLNTHKASLIAYLNTVVATSNIHDKQSNKRLNVKTLYKAFRACFRACNNTVIKALKIINARNISTAIDNRIVVIKKGGIL